MGDKLGKEEKPNKIKALRKRRGVGGQIDIGIWGID